jgi:hypothetical protein
MKAEGRFGNTKASHYLEDLVKNNKHDSRSVTRLLSGLFRVLNEVYEKTSPDVFEYVSKLAIDDFVRGVKEAPTKYSNKDIPDIMINVAKTKRKLLIKEKRDV